MRITWVMVLGLLLWSGVSPAQAPAETAEGVFQEWLAAFNSGEAAAIKGFYGKRLGDPDAVMMLEIAEDTCGLAPVRMEARTATALSVVLAEKCFPALQRLKLELGAPGEQKLKAFELKSFALTVPGANAAIAGMADRLAAHDRFAGSLLVMQGDKQLLARNWGLLDRGGRPISFDTPMFLASAGKMFTAVAVLQLVDAGRIELDAPLGRYLTGYPNAEMAKVTIRQLLQHRGGTGDVGVLARNEGANRARARTIDQIVALNDNRAPSFPPGSKAEYSNYGFLLLGAVIERVSGKSYYDYVAQHVFEPAGMDHAGFPDLAHLQGVATGYTTFYGEEAALVSHRSALPWRGTSAGGGVASANDMVKFFAAMRAGKLLSPAMFKLATTAGPTPWYGMGFVVGSKGNWGHGGNSYGMDVAAHHTPATDITFICLAPRDMVCNRLIQAWAMRTGGLIE